MIVPVILSGGSGTRLWPLSRTMYPKQFIRFFNGQGSLLGATLRRVDDGGFAAPIIICNNDHRFLVREELARAGDGGRRRSSSSRSPATRRRRLPSRRWPPCRSRPAP